MRLVAAALLAGVFLAAPTAVADAPPFTLSGTQGDNGWWRSSVTAHVTASISGCPSPPFDITFNTSADKFSCGNAGLTLSLQFNIDKDPPSVNGGAADRAPDVNGWYTHPVSVGFSGADGNSGLAGCTTGTYSGPDSATASVTGTCRDNAGNVSGASSLSFKYDGTPPMTTATPTKPPNAEGWYTQPVTVKFAATDATSGVASCSDPVKYHGPDNGAVTLTGTCTDQAGNQSSASYTFKYDTTPPHVGDVSAVLGGDAITVTWQLSKDATTATVLRAPGRGKEKVSIVYHGPASQFRDTTVQPGVTYHYTVATTDAAGNDARVKVTAVTRQLYAPAPGARAVAGTLLKWAPSSGASYYNLQLFRGTKKVLSTWPAQAQYRLPRAWSYGGHHYSLERGTYRWYVWPGRGARSAARYGKLLGGSTFTVR